ncbi:MAG: hypothetical protein CM15mP68_5850 [Pseudomonadota bacterium]|nr:MAG: hypothetical protein CM15mP68_5850 [Pseudomonadota bacterium]
MTAISKRQKMLNTREFMALDWNSDDLSKVDVWRIQMALLTYLVDLFDVYDKYHSGLVDRSHLDTRMRTLSWAS